MEKIRINLDILVVLSLESGEGMMQEEINCGKIEMFVSSHEKNGCVYVF